MLEVHGIGESSVRASIIAEILDDEACFVRLRPLYVKSHDSIHPCALSLAGLLSGQM